MKKLFKKKATITTSNNETYNIKAGRYFIMPKYGKRRHKHVYGNKYVITKVEPETESLKPNDISFIGEIFSFDDNRLRFLKETYKDTKIFDTEEHDNGIESPITVIEAYDDMSKQISSIGNIVRFESDIKEASFDKEVTTVIISPELVKRLTKRLKKKRYVESKKDL